MKLFLSRLARLAPFYLACILGLGLIVLFPMGPGLDRIPGDLGDARLNSYLLEHGFQWLQGSRGDFWNPGFFYPFADPLAFGDNLLGSLPIYAALRAAGLQRVSAFQAWYVLGFLLNFLAAGWVLNRLGFSPLAGAAGAFLFTFGLPVLAQETHAQLLYRAALPLAAYQLWQFHHRPRLALLAGLLICLVWQFWASIYLGIFLSLLLAGMLLLLPIFFPPPASTTPRWRAALGYWPERTARAWQQASPTQRALLALPTLGLALAWLALLWPYYHVTREYGFTRTWEYIQTMLPSLRSFLLADSSQIWGPLSARVPLDTARNEHQLFLGAGALGLLLAGLLGRFPGEQRRPAFFHLACAGLLILLTLDINGLSLYRLAWALPGMKSLRAITRIFLVALWPLSVFSAYALDGLLRAARKGSQALAWVALVLLLLESSLYTHNTYSKAEDQARLDGLRAQLNAANLPEQPILFVGNATGAPWYVPEIDGMLLAQEQGWPTLNGYSGNFPPGYFHLGGCGQLPARIQAAMQHAVTSDPEFYFAIMRRVVTLNFDDCNPAWWQKMPD